jgi:hypothetical protein
MKRTTTFAAAITLFANMATAGLPLTCHPFDIGNEKSLPWGSGEGWETKAASYDTGRLVGDTLALLTPDTPVIVRMETLRRAAMYSGQKSDLVHDLSSRLMERANKPHPDALAAFDAGYFIETVHQYNWERPDPLKGMDGYSLARKSVAMAKDVAAVEYGLALMQAMKSWPNDHYRNAVLGAKEGSLLADTLLRNANATSLSSLRNTVLARR